MMKTEDIKATTSETSVKTRRNPNIQNQYRGDDELVTSSHVFGVGPSLLFGLLPPPFLRASSPLLGTPTSLLPSLLVHRSTIHVGADTATRWPRLPLTLLTTSLPHFPVGMAIMGNGRSLAIGRNSNTTVEVFCIGWSSSGMIRVRRACNRDGGISGDVASRSGHCCIGCAATVAADGVYRRFAGR